MDDDAHPLFYLFLLCMRVAAESPLTSCVMLLLCLLFSFFPQTYRHCDSVSIEPRLIQDFYGSWMRSGSTFHRAAILFGRYQPEPASTNNPGAVRANVHALYEPPQENAKDFVRFLKDPHEKVIHQLALKLGLEVVGWIVTTLERKGDKYGGPVFMSGLEVQQAARFQNRYKDQFGYSKFVTIVMEHADTVEPHAYQVSDLAVCLERDGVFAKVRPMHRTERQCRSAHCSRLLQSHSPLCCLFLSPPGSRQQHDLHACSRRE